MTNERYLSFTEAVLYRPTMYTPAGTYNEVVAFLTGYWSGRAKCDLYDPAVREWSQFQQWLREKFGETGRDTFSAFRAPYSEDGAAIAALRDAYAQFLAEAAETS